MKLQRKLKKRIVKTFGRGTCIGIKNEYLTFKKYYKNRDVETVFTDKAKNDNFQNHCLHAHQYNPYLTFKNLY